MFGIYYSFLQFLNTLKISEKKKLYNFPQYTWISEIVFGYFE